MKKKLLLGMFLLMSFTAFTQETSPMSGWEYEYKESFKEQDGYAIVSGAKFHYWLYDTISYHDGYSNDIYNKYIPHWIEKMGHVIDFDNIRVTDPNTALASSVKALMRQRGCDVSVALVGGDYVVINEYFKSRDVYKTTIYPFYTEVSETMYYLGFTTDDGVEDLGAVTQANAYQKAVADRDTIIERAYAQYNSGGMAGNVSDFLESVQTEFLSKERLQQGHLYKVWWQQSMDDKNAVFVVYFWLGPNNKLTEATGEEILYCYLE